MTLAGVSVPRIVLDTNVCLDLFLFHDRRCATLLAALQAGTVQAVTRDDCCEEWNRVLHYAQLPVDDHNRPAVSAAYAALVHRLPSAESTGVVDIVLPRCKDPDDQKFMELAVATGARWLLSKDNALLRLDQRTRALAGFSILRPDAWALPPD